MMEQNMDAQLNVLRELPPRDAEAVREGRKAFLAQMNVLQESYVERPPSVQRTGLNWGTRRIALLSMLLMVSLAIFSTAMAAASRNALPGDRLFTVKASLEDARAIIGFSNERTADLHLAYAENRLSDIKSLIELNRPDDIPSAVENLNHHLFYVVRNSPALEANYSSRLFLITRQTEEVVTGFDENLSTYLVTIEPPRAASASYGIFGVIDTIEPGSIVAAGQKFVVTTDTEIRDPIQQGQTIGIQTIVADDGTLFALVVESYEKSESEGNQESTGEENPLINETENVPLQEDGPENATPANGESPTENIDPCELNPTECSTPEPTEEVGEGQQGGAGGGGEVPVDPGEEDDEGEDGDENEPGDGGEDEDEQNNPADPGDEDDDDDGDGDEDSGGEDE